MKTNFFLIIILLPILIVADIQNDSLRIIENIESATNKISIGGCIIFFACISLGVGIAVRPTNSSGPFSASEANIRDVRFGYSGLYTSLSIPIFICGSIPFTIGIVQLHKYKIELRNIHNESTIYENN